MSKKSIYLAIKEALKVKLPDLFIDLQKGQFLKPSENLPVPLPAVLVEFNNIPWTEHSRISQKGDATFTVHLYQEALQSTFDESEAESDTLDMLNANSEVFKTINGLQGDDFSYVERKSEGKPQYGDGWVKFSTDFKINIIEEY